MKPRGKGGRPPLYMTDPQRPAAPWDRQNGESQQAYDAFRAFLAMPKRSARALAKEMGRHVTLTGQWSARWKWQDRAGEYDSHRLAEETAARDAVAAETAKEWERRRLAERERLFRVGSKISEKAEAMLDAGLYRKRVDGGKTIVEPAKWTMATAAGMLVKGAELIHIAIEGDGPDDGFDPLTATPEENQAWIQRQLSRNKAVRDLAKGGA